MRQKQKSFSALITRVSVIATALSLVVMICATAMVGGFQHVIRAKAYSLWGHIQITEFTDNHSYENSAIHLSQKNIAAIKQLNFVQHIQPFITKPGIIKKNEQIEGIVLKGIDSTFSNAFMKQYLKQKNENSTADVNSIFNFKDSVPSNQIIISQKIAQRLNIKLNENCLIYFVDKTPRVRKLKVAAIYSTGMEEFDKVYSFVDLRMIQKLNGWKNKEVGGYEIFVNPIEKMDTVCATINTDILPLNLSSQTIRQLFPTLFDWLNLQNTTEVIIVVLILIVALINVISGLLILILERTQMIGILKTLGMNAGKLRSIFLYQATYIVLKGMLWGNIIGIGICAAQYFFKIIKLPEETYYISEVAIYFNWWLIVAINPGFIVISLLSLLLPAIVINYIRPIKAVRFE